MNIHDESDELIYDYRKVIIFVIIFLLLVGITVYFVSETIEKQVKICEKLCKEKRMEIFGVGQISGRKCICLNSNNKLEEFWIK